MDGYFFLIHAHKYILYLEGLFKRFAMGSKEGDEGLHHSSHIACVTNIVRTIRDSLHIHTVESCIRKKSIKKKKKKKGEIQTRNIY